MVFNKVKILFYLIYIRFRGRISAYKLKDIECYFDKKLKMVNVNI